MRFSKLTPQQVTLLRDWGDRLRSMFHDAKPYHVGSSVDGKPDQGFRDVDVRVLMADKQHRQLSKIVDMDRLNVALTVWGERVTGLPIDCQVQSLAEANSDENKGRRRNPAWHMGKAQTDDR